MRTPRALVARPAPSTTDVPEPGVGARAQESRLYFRAALAAAIALGVFVRVFHVLNADFPLNDGGLFFAMARDFQDSAYRLPAFTSYNGGVIPFAYPPLGLFAAAVLDDFSPLSLFDAFRFLPLLYSVLTLGAFFLLVRSMLQSRVAQVAAVAAFALIPRTFIWLLMGGGVTRSLGFLLAVLALWQAHRMYTTREGRHVLPTMLLSGGTVLAHLETGWFLCFSIAIMWLFYGRNRRSIEHSAIVAAGAGLIVLPWFLLIVDRHGIEAFLAANATGGSIFTGGGITEYVLLSLARVVSTSEPFFPMIGVIGVLGAFVCAVTGRWHLIVWWVAIVALDVRAFPTFTSIPVAMLVGIAFAEVLMPVLQRAAPHVPVPLHAVHDDDDGDAAEEAARTGERRRAGGLLPAGFGMGPMIAIYVVLCFGTVSALVTAPGLGGEGASLSALTQDQRAVMQWIAEETPAEATFLVIPRGPWATDKESEWFPVLAQRPSVATVQGTEWLPNRLFDRQVRAFDHAWSCGYWNVDCLDNWLKAYPSGFTHVYVPGDRNGQCCGSLLDSMRKDPGYRLLYDGPGGTVFARTPGGRSTPSIFDPYATP